MQLSDKSVNVKIDRIMTKGWRIQAQLLNLPSGRILWINTYLPNDPGPASANWDAEELVTSLKQVEDILSSAQYDECVWLVW